MEVDLFESAFTRKRGVEHIEGSGIPPGARRRPLKDVPSFPNDPPNFAFVRNPRLSIQRVEKL